MIPVGDQLFRVGATYEWDVESAEPTPQGLEMLEKMVKSFCVLPYEIVNHQAGLRPIVRMSQPVIGPYTAGSNQWVFNGLGSKGALMAPHVSDCLAAALLSNKIIPSEWCAIDYFSSL
jgi:glycine/D-amino acid oxidase-like deaminating enzyme